MPTTTEAAGTLDGYFEATGSGTAITIDTDPPGRETSVPLPWRRAFSVPASTQVLQIVIVGGGNPGCRIVVEGKVVAEQPPGGSAHCVYTR